MDFLSDDTRLTDVCDEEIELSEIKRRQPITRDCMRERGASEAFSDGMKRIDYVLVYEPSSHHDQETEAKRQVKRQSFEHELVESGLILEREGTEKSEDGKSCFVKIHAPWEFLISQAEEMKIRMPISTTEHEDLGLQDCIGRLLKSTNPFELSEEFNVNEPDYYTAPFIAIHADKFMPLDKDYFFTPSQRSRMVYDVLIRTPYDASFPSRVGIKRMLKNGSYTAHFPLHEGGHTHNEERLLGGQKVWNERQLLYETWAKPTRFYKYQPMDLIRRYFGEKIAMYFAWLGFYTKLLVLPALVGIICVVYGGSTLESDPPSNDICDNAGMWNGTSYTPMCQNCDTGCPLWNISDSCKYAKVTHVFDNVFTVIFAVFMSLWATLFLEGWKRYHAEICWDWDLTDFHLDEEQVRPEYQTRAPAKRVNPLTHEEEPFMPYSKRMMRICASAVAVLFFLCLVLAFVFGVIIYRVIISHVLYQHQVIYPTIVTSVTAAALNLTFILILGRVYESLAWYLTEWEFPRTQDEFESSYTFKVFLFQFINFYSSLFYIAFFKGKWLSLPGKDEALLFRFYRPEQCDPAGCMVELVIQLAIIMVGKQIFNNFLEICFPIVYNWWRSLANKWERKDTIFTRWEKDYALNAVPDMALFNEYLEMVIQFGFVTLFVTAFPLAPLFALINNVMEVRLDAFKFVVAYRRPMPAKAKDIGAWYMILDAISKLAVLTNACVIAFTSDFVPRMVFFYTYGKYSLDGFIDYSLSYYRLNQTLYMDNGLNASFCRFRDWRKAPCDWLKWKGESCANDYEEYGLSLKWWHVMASKLAFVLIFLFVVFAIKGAVSYLIPDTPRKIRDKIQIEHQLARKARREYELEKRHSRQSRKWKNRNNIVNGNNQQLTANLNNGLVECDELEDDFHYSPHNTELESSSDSLPKNFAQQEFVRL